MQNSYFQKRYKGTLDSILGGEDFEGNSMQRLQVDAKGYTPDGFKAGKSTFYNGNSGDVKYKQMQFTGGYTYGKEKGLIKGLAKTLGGALSFFPFSYFTNATYGHYEGEKFVKGKPRVEGTKATYILKDLSSWGNIFCTGGRKAEVEVTFDRAANTVDVK